uniref:Reverse transcriptase domain-containing protein n=1 Tax=Kryptolebias marmoratus TaxID=37003 RepID=A0A3Q3ABX6_KRYMA
TDRDLERYPLFFKVKDYRTNWFSTSLGVKQGHVLSPTLFALCINDLVTVNEHDLQKLLSIVYCWCNKMRLMINCDKTEVIHFNKLSHTLTTFTFCLEVGFKNALSRGVESEVNPECRLIIKKTTNLLTKG